MEIAGQAGRKKGSKSDSHSIGYVPDNDCVNKSRRKSRITPE